VRLLIPAGALVVLGGVVALLGSSVAVDAVGITLIGFGVVFAVAALFLAVGESEDRERRGSGR
jgi:lipid-A-disaccharide synthase-like uncharacterized protein